MDFFEVMEIVDGLIKSHRVYWGWRGVEVIKADAYYKDAEAPRSKREHRFRRISKDTITLIRLSCRHSSGIDLTTAQAPYGSGFVN
jgi:hypothetical protein